LSFVKKESIVFVLLISLVTISKFSRKWQLQEIVLCTRARKFDHKHKARKLSNLNRELQVIGNSLFLKMEEKKLSIQHLTSW
jgi:hypothetical protein